MRRDIVHRMDAPADVVGRVGTVLRAVAANEPTGVTTTQLARSTGLARPTAHRLLTSLLGDGLLDRNEDGRWFLGPELYLLGMTAAPRYDVTTVAQPFVRRLASTTGESAFFSARRGDETVCLVREDGSFPIRSHVLHEGIRFPLGVASAGIAILAYLRRSRTTSPGQTSRPTGPAMSPIKCARESERPATPASHSTLDSSSKAAGASALPSSTSPTDRSGR